MWLYAGRAWLRIIKEIVKMVDKIPHIKKTKQNKTIPCLMLVNDSWIEGGGAERRIKLLLKEFIKKKVLKRIIFLHSNEKARNLKIISAFDGMKIPKGIEFRLYYYPKEKTSYKSTKKIINETNPDIIQFHNVGNIYVIKAITDSKKPTIFVAHDYWPICGKRHLIDPYDARNKKICHTSSFFKCIPCIGVRPYLKIRKIQKFMRKVNLGIAPAEITKKIYEKHDVLVNRWRIIIPWIDTILFKPKGNIKGNIKRNNDVLFVGSLLDYKGAWVITEAFVKISKAVPDSRLLFIGPVQEKNGISRKRIEKIAKENGFFDKVVFLGVKPWKEIVKYHRKCGVYACPPVSLEIFGLNWAEALASGCPVVASRIGGIPELLDGNGILVNPKDIEGLADAVIKVLMDRKLAERMGEEGSRMVLSRFNVKRACDDFVQLYRSLVRLN